MFDLEYLGHGHRVVKRRQWSYAMANIDLYKSHTRAFFARSRRFPDIHISKCDLKNLSHGHDVQHSKSRHSMASIWT